VEGRKGGGRKEERKQGPDDRIKHDFICKMNVQDSRHSSSDICRKSVLFLFIFLVCFLDTGV
jgi:hypothetical protein